MHALPENIARRTYFSICDPAPYRAWDDDGDTYLISGRHGSWAARCPHEPAKPQLFAPTLVRLSTKLAKTRFPRPHQLTLKI
jgi:hypothetical protein